MNETQQILNILEKLVTGQKTIQADISTLKGDTSTLKDGQKNHSRELAHIKTAIKPLATKEDIEIAVNTAKAEIQADILNLGAKQARKEHQQDNRIENLEEHTGTTNPTKN